MKDKKLVVFDWNGTVLADTQACWKASNHCLEFFGRPAISMKQYRETVHFPVLHFYKLNGCCVDDVLARQGEANALFYHYYRLYSKGSRTRAGLRELLVWLEAQGADRTILSNYITGEIELELERLKLGSFFSHVCGNGDGNTVLQHATKPQRLSAFMIKRGYRPDNTYLIGDSTEEPEIAHQLGLTCISLTGGYFSERRLRGAEPHYMVDGHQEIVGILGALF